ncbi:MAG TPA: CAP domain-containing protein, partial [Chloroflexota bacterium]
MAKLRLTLAALALVLASLGALAPVAGATPAEQARIVELTNQARAANGLPPVSANAALNMSAEAYSLSMATLNFFDHQGRDGSTFSSRNEAAGYTGWTWMGENIAAGQQSADQVFQAWMNSPSH